MSMSLLVGWTLLKGNRKKKVSVFALDHTLREGREAAFRKMGRFVTQSLTFFLFPRFVEVDSVQGRLSAVRFDGVYYVSVRITFRH